MTHDEITNLSDAQLDAAIAGMFEAKPTERDASRAKWWGISILGEVVPRQSSQCIEDAWRVVEAMRERGYNLSLVSNFNPGEWWASFHGGGGSSATADTATRAICKAALMTADIDAARKGKE